MSAELLAKIRKKREFRVQIDERRSVTVRRPTDAEWLRYGANGSDDPAIASACAVDWHGFTENDLDGEGCTDTPKFDSGLWREWVMDRRAVWVKVVSAIIDAYTAHQKEQEEAAKNSEPGSG